MRDILFENITILHPVRYAIGIDQNGQGAVQRSPAQLQVGSGSNVSVTNVTFRAIRATLSGARPPIHHLPNLIGGLFTCNPGHLACTGIVMDDVQFHSPDGKGTGCLFKNVYGHADNATSPPSCRPPLKSDDVGSATIVNNATRANRHAGKNSLRPPMGWTTWCTDGTCGPHPEVCTDTEVRSVALAMKEEGLLAAGWDRINLDDCWSSQDRDAKGWLVPVAERFPHGMKALADFLHALGFKLGLYLSGGRKTCRGQVGSYGYYTQDADAYTAWGIDYVKEDWCDAQGLNLRAELAKRRAALDRSNRTFWYQCPCLTVGQPGGSGCTNTTTGGPPLWLGEMCDSWRFYDDHHDVWSSTSDIIEQGLAVRARFNKPGQWHDPDYLLTGGQGCINRTVPGLRCPMQTDNEYMTEFSLWSLTASPLVFASDPRNMSALQRKCLLNAELIAINQDGPDLNGVFHSAARVGFDSSCARVHATGSSTAKKNASRGATARRTASGFHNTDVDTGRENANAGRYPGYCEIWARRLSDGGVAVVMYNNDEAARKMTAHFDSLGDDASMAHAASVRDLWTHTTLPSKATMHTAVVEAHGVVVLRLSPPA